MTKTLEDFKIRSDAEADTHWIMHQAREREWAPDRQVILHIFTMMWTSSLNVAQIVKIAEAVHHLHNLHRGDIPASTHEADP